MLKPISAMTAFTTLAAAMGLSGCLYDNQVQDNTALLIIDAQQAYVQGSEDFWIDLYYPDLEFPPQNVDADLANKIDRIVSLTEQAVAEDFTMAITYEGFAGEASPFIDAIEAKLPADITRLYKIYFDSTLQPEVLAQVQQWQADGIERIIVSGAETDVCVLQTVSGLRKMGFEVVLSYDAVFSTEPYVAPALKRMAQMGVELVSTEQVLEFMAGKPVQFDNPYQVTLRDELYQGDRTQMAAISYNLDSQSLAAAVHPNKDAVLERLNLWANFNHFVFGPVTDWGLYHVNEQGLGQSNDLSDYLPWGDAAFGDNALLPVSPLQQNKTQLADAISDIIGRGESQVVLSGVFSDGELSQAVTELLAAGITPVLMEDGILGAEHDPMAAIDHAYNLGAVPSSYKTIGYEMVKAVYLADLSEAEILAWDDMVTNGTLHVIPEVLPRVR